MTTARIIGGATIEVAPLTYLKDLQFRTLFRLGLGLKDALAKMCNVDSELIISLIHDFCLVSIRVQTDHAISEFFANPTTDDMTFRDYFVDFINCLTDDTYALAFDDIIRAVRQLDKPQADEHQLPEKPTDPN
jgi:hypothetical protein